MYDAMSDRQIHNMSQRFSNDFDGLFDERHWLKGLRWDHFANDFFGGKGKKERENKKEVKVTDWQKAKVFFALGVVCAYCSCTSLWPLMANFHVPIYRPGLSDTINRVADRRLCIKIRSACDYNSTSRPDAWKSVAAAQLGPILIRFWSGPRSGPTRRTRFCERKRYFMCTKRTFAKKKKKRADVESSESKATSR